MLECMPLHVDLHIRTIINSTDSGSFIRELCKCSFKQNSYENLASKDIYVTVYDISIENTIFKEIA